MQRIKIEYSSLRIIIPGIIMAMIVFVQLPCRAQVQCRDSLNSISQAYNDGEWSRAKDAARRYVGSNKDKFTFFYAGSKNDTENCVSYLPQVYYYLIKSCIRLYEPDSAVNYYKDALKNQVVINFDTADSDIKQYFPFKRTQWSIGGFAGVSSSSNKNHAAFKIGLQYGKHRNFKLEAYGEISFNQRYFNHQSNQRVGAFGKSLLYDPRIFPNYVFTITGKERFLDLLYYAKFPIALPFFERNLGVKSYFSTGVFVSYYINSSVNSYRIYKNKSLTDTTLYQADGYSRSVDALGLDLKALYSNRFSYGAIFGYGNNFRIAKAWEMFIELRYTLGTNFKYKFDEFNSYKVGISYLTFMIGIRKNTIEVK